MLKLGRCQLITVLAVSSLVFQGVRAQETFAVPDHVELAIRHGDHNAAVAQAKVLLTDGQTPEGITRALGLLRAASAQNHGEAQMLLGDILLRGLYGVPISTGEGRRLLERASTTRADAKLKLAEYLLSGQHLDANPARATAMLTELSNLGISRASYVLADAFVRGDRGVSRDLPKGIELFEVAIASGSLEATARFGDYLLSGNFVPTDVAKGLEFLHLAAEAGSGAAHLRIGTFYLRGNPDIPADEGVAQFHLEQAVAAGSSEAMTVLGDLLARRVASPADQERGLTLLERASQKGLVRATFLLGRFYLSRHSHPGDSEKALDLLTAASNRGSAEAKLMLGENLIKGNALAADPPRGVALLEELIEIGSPRATFVLGNILLSGLHGQPEQPERGRALLETAALAGVLSANRVLGEHLLVGGHPAEGVRLLTLAAEEGDVRSAYRLGAYYTRLPNATELQIALGVKWLRQAATRDDADAMSVLGAHLLTVATADDAHPEAISMLSAAAGKGNASAAYTLGNAYLEGRYGLAKDISAGIDLIQEASDRGHSWAIVRLAAAHLHGEGVPTDPARAKELYDLALALGNDFAVGPLAGLLFAGTLSGRKDNEAALALLDAEAREGNLIAIQQLLTIFGDGKWQVTEANSERWREYYQLLRQSGRADLVAAEDTLARVRGRDGIEDYSAAADMLDSLSAEQQRSIISRMVRVNPNAYVYVLQVRLKKADLYRGSLNGQLGSSTIRAIKEACRTIGPGSACLAPLSAATARYLISYL